MARSKRAPVPVRNAAGMVYFKGRSAYHYAYSDVQRAVDMKRADPEASDRGIGKRI